jgi:hypothetical protein
LFKYSSDSTKIEMVNTSQITKTQHAVPIIAAAVLFAIFGLGYFVVGFDQGQIFSIFEGQSAYAQMNGVGYMHEFAHDMRHASGFPCH